MRRNNDALPSHFEGRVISRKHLSNSTSNIAHEARHGALNDDDTGDIDNDSVDSADRESDEDELDLDSGSDFQTERDDGDNDHQGEQISRSLLAGVHTVDSANLQATLDDLEVNDETA